MNLPLFLKNQDIFSILNSKKHISLMNDARETLCWPQHDSNMTDVILLSVMEVYVSKAKEVMRVIGCGWLWWGCSECVGPQHYCSAVHLYTSCTDWLYN